MSLNINQYRLYCNTEAVNVTTWSSTTPIVCPNNNTHVIDTNSITIINTVSKNIVEIQEETPTNNPTQGRFRCNGLESVITTTTTTIKDVSWVYPISAFSIRFNTLQENAGDYIDVYVIPTILLGNTSSIVSSGATVISVTSSCFSACTVGLQIFITDNTNTFFLGAIISSDSTNSTITITNPTDNTYNTNSFITYTQPIGINTQIVNVNNTTINVSSSVINNMTIGEFISITDGTTMTNLGEIFEVDTINSTILIQDAPTTSYNAGCYLYPSLHVIKKYKINSPNNYIIGGDIIGGSYICPFYIIRLVYINSSSTAKNFNWYVEYKY